MSSILKKGTVECTNIFAVLENVYFHCMGFLFIVVNGFLSLALIFDICECAHCSWFVICSKVLKVSDSNSTFQNMTFSQ